MRKRPEIQTVLREKEIINIKEVRTVVELEQLRLELQAFEEPLKEVRDSL